MSFTASLVPWVFFPRFSMHAEALLRAAQRVGNHWPAWEVLQNPYLPNWSEAFSYRGLAVVSSCSLLLIAHVYSLNIFCGFLKERNGIHWQLSTVGWEERGPVWMGHTDILWWDGKIAAKRKSQAACCVLMPDIVTSLWNTCMERQSKARKLPDLSSNRLFSS